MESSSIQWTNNTFNPWQGCAKISPGCANCYAKVQVDDRFGRAKWGPNGTRTRTKDWSGPRRWNAKAAAENTRTMVFCASLADVFEDRAELAPWRDELHQLIAETPQLDWQLLTKRPHVAAEYYSTHPIPDNVWLGTSVENREMALRRIPILRQIPARIKFLSCEPLLDHLGELELHEIDWVIVGGESGHGFRPMDAAWAKSIRDQCAEQHVAFFFKQWSARAPKALGAELDGKTYRQFPAASIYASQR